MAFESSDEIIYINSSTGQPMTQGYRIFLRIWNSGRQSIVPEDNYGPFEFDFGPNAGIQEAEIEDKNPPTMGVTAPIIDQSCTKVSLAKPSTPFNKKYWVKIKVIALNFTGNIHVYSSIRDCEIKEIPQYLIRSRQICFFCTYAILLIFLSGTLISSVFTHTIVNQFYDLVIVGGIWFWWFARKLDFSPKKFRSMLKALPLVVILLICYMVLHIITIYLLVPSILKIFG